MNTKFVLFVAVLALSACGGGNSPIENPQPMVVTDSVIWDGDSELAPLLRRPQLGAVEWEAAERIELRVGAFDFIERLGTVAEDTAAPWLVRLNAIRVLENRRAIGELSAFGVAMRASDERVRIAAVAAMREFLGMNTAGVWQILERGLRDPSPRVQTAALQIIADRDVTMLRDYLGRTKNVELRTIALDLIRAAEERGAPLVSDASGMLERTTSSGTKVTFRPTTRWPNWEAAVGELIVTPLDGKPVPVASGVEVVGNVVPAFFNAEGTTLVYEANREIRARDLTTGTDTKLADGIAPRVLPFTNDVVYFVEARDKRIQTSNGFGLRYDVYRVPVTGGTPVTIGQIGSSMRNDLHGNYSPTRWTRIEEQDGEFYLASETISPFKLPNPFAN